MKLKLLFFFLWQKRLMFLISMFWWASFAFALSHIFFYKNSKTFKYMFYFRINYILNVAVFLNVCFNSLLLNWDHNVLKEQVHLLKMRKKYTFFFVKIQKEKKRDKLQQFNNKMHSYLLVNMKKHRSNSYFSCKLDVNIFEEMSCTVQSISYLL